MRIDIEWNLIIKFVLYILQVYKSAKTGKKLAVDRLCLGVPQGEVSYFIQTTVDATKRLTSRVLCEIFLSLVYFQWF